MTWLLWQLAPQLYQLICKFMIFYPLAYFGFCQLLHWGTLFFSDTVCPLQSILLLLNFFQVISNLFPTCTLLSAFLLCLSFLTRELCPWRSLWPNLTTDLPKDRSSPFIQVLAEMVFTQRGPAWLPLPSLSYFPRLFSIFRDLLLDENPLCIYTFIVLLECKLLECRDPVPLAECVFLLPRRVADT